MDEQNDQKQQAENQETPEQPEVTPEPQPEAPAQEEPSVEKPADSVEEPTPPPAPVPVPSPSGAPPAATQNTNIYIIWGWVLVGLSFLFFCCCGPIFFAIPAIILGFIAHSKGDQRGIWIIIAGVVALLLLLAGSGSGVLLRHSPNWIPNFQHRLPVIPGGRPV